MEERLFFELLQVAIGSRQSLSVTPSANQWSELLALSKKHALVAIAFHGVTLLKARSSDPDDFGASLGIDKLTYLKWLGLTAKYAQRNKELNAECTKVCQEFAHDGLQSVVLKGQSNLVHYPEDLRKFRSAGDIDLWCNVPERVVVAHEIYGKIEKREYRGLEGVIEYCKQYEHSQGREIQWHCVLYYHCELTSVSGIGVEPHYRPSYLNSPLRNWRLQRWFKENEPWGICEAKVDDYVFPILPVSTNVVYQLLHINKHLFEEGIGLRQLLDYFFCSSCVLHRTRIMF